MLFNLFGWHFTDTVGHETYASRKIAFRGKKLYIKFERNKKLEKNVQSHKSLGAMSSDGKTSLSEKAKRQKEDEGKNRLYSKASALHSTQST